MREHLACSVFACSLCGERNYGEHAVVQVNTPQPPSVLAMCITAWDTVQLCLFKCGDGMKGQTVQVDLPASGSTCTDLCCITRKRFQ